MGRHAFAAIALVCSACGAGFAGQGNAAELVRIRAGKDLSCPEKDVSVNAEWGGMYQATGCGRVLRYHSACEGLRCSVGLVDEDAPAWRDRPAPGSADDQR